MNAICKDNKRLWKIWKEKYVAVPKILVDLIFEGWRRIYRKRADAINFVKMGFDAKTKITVDWSQGWRIAESYDQSVFHGRVAEGSRIDKKQVLKG